MSPQNPDLPNTGVVEDKALDKESVIDFLGEDDAPETLELEKATKDRKTEKDEKDKKDSKEGEEEGDEDLSLEDELEEELDEPEADKLELIETPSRKEILSAYPDLFKKFPQLEKSIYRERAYSELLPTIEDAKLSVEKSTLLDTYEQALMEGSTESILQTVKDGDKEAFNKVVDNYLPNLYKVDQHAYYHTIGNVIKHTVVSMVRDGKDNEELATAAAVLNQYIFGTTKFTHPQNLAKDDLDEGSKEKENQISQREKEFVEKQYNSAKGDLGVRVDNILKSTVDKAIDPNDSMSDFVKRVATREVLEGLEGLISRDNRFKSIYDRLWEKAFESDFSKESMDRIKSAYLSKAKTLLPVLIRQARNEALRGNRRNNDDNDTRDRKGPLPVGKTRSSTTLASGRANSSGSNKDSKGIPRGMTTLDYLNQD